VRAGDGIDVRLELGEIAALLSPNGAGETTTIDTILGLGRPEQGTVRVLGMTPAAAISRGPVAAVMQTGGLLKDLTVRETVRLTASVYAQPRPVDEVLERAGIAGIADRVVGKCSGGEHSLRFALALLPDPALMALDEPTSGMDVEGRRDFWTAIRRDAEQGRTVLFDGSLRRGGNDPLSARYPARLTVGAATRHPDRADAHERPRHRHAACRASYAVSPGSARRIASSARNWSARTDPSRLPMARPISAAERPAKKR
jgi:ABC-type branched-subunit amino acid transport system ATPase component